MPDLGPLWLSLALAAVTTIILLVVGTPLAWWLSNTSARIKPAIEAVTALPLVLPPTVLGFYFLIALGPASPIGAFWISMTGDALTFSFAGLVVASVFYSLPFMVQPLQNAFEAIGRKPLEAAASLRAGTGARGSILRDKTGSSEVTDIATCANPALPISPRISASRSINAPFVTIVTG